MPSSRWPAGRPRFPPRQAARENAPPLPDLLARIDAHPLARVPQHLLALDLRAAADPGRRAAAIQEAMNRYGATKDDAELGALAAWLYAKGEFDKALAILPPERADGDRALFLQRLDTLGALGPLGGHPRRDPGTQIPAGPAVCADVPGALCGPARRIRRA